MDITVPIETIVHSTVKSTGRMAEIGKAFPHRRFRMMKKLVLFMGILVMFQCSANEKSFFSGKYWGHFVPYTNANASANENKKKYLAVVIYFQEDILTIVSASRTCKTKYNIKNGIIIYRERNGNYLISRNLFYDQSNTILYYKKPGFWYFIPQKVIYNPIQADVAQKAIDER
ncbi:hypothetical protein II906_00435 [bacterium]|nr:hypothetical protein [bacterium]